MKLGRRKWLWVIGIILLLPVLLLVFLRFQGQWGLARLKKDLLRRGEKLTVQENEPARSRAPNEFRNFIGTVSLLQTTEVTLSLPPTGRQVGPGQLVPLRYMETWGATRGRTNGTWPALTAALAASSNTLAQVKVLLHRPELAAQVDYDAQNKFPAHVPLLMGLARHLNGAATESVHAGQLETAKDHITDLLATSQLLSRDRLLISQLVRGSVLLMAISPTWQAIQSGGLTDSQLLELQRAWQAAQILPQFIATLEMERALTIENFAAMRRSVSILEGELNGPATRTAGNTTSDSLDDIKNQVMTETSKVASRNILMPTWQFAFSHEDERRGLQLVQTILDAARACAKERSATPFQQKRLPPKQPADAGLARIRDLLAWSLSSSLSRALEGALTAETQKQLVVAALAIHRYTLQQGHPPATLDALVPQWLETLPHDYWSGKPLLYRTNLTGAPLLYSVGPNGRDDGGVPADDKKWANSPPLFKGRDLVWPVPTPESELPEALKALGCNSVQEEVTRPRPGRGGK